MSEVQHKVYIYGHFFCKGGMKQPHALVFFCFEEEENVN